METPKFKMSPAEYGRSEKLRICDKSATDNITGEIHVGNVLASNNE
jgi:hypothetical protein